MTHSIIPHNSVLYHKSVILRYEILREPLGLSFSDNELAKENNQIHFISQEKHKIIACLILVPEKNDVIKMRQVCVQTNMQGKGIGKSLIHYAERYCLQHNYHYIYCHARQEAVDFYTHLGYKKEGDIFFEIGIPHIKMEKLLK